MAAPVNTAPAAARKLASLACFGWGGFEGEALRDKL